jgi:hypothetical protein
MQTSCVCRAVGGKACLSEWPTKVFQGVSLVSLWHEDDPTSCVIYPAVQERSRAMFAATDAALITRSHGVKEQRAIWV